VNLARRFDAAWLEAQRIAIGERAPKQQCLAQPPSGGVFGRAWRLAGQRGEPSVEAVDLEGGLAGLRSDRINFATAAGGRTGGAELPGPLLVYGEAMSRR
jgi:hypothetical protein